MNNQNIKFEHISTYCLIRTLIRHLWMIVAAGLIFAMSTSLYLTWIHAPQYRADMTYAVMSRVSSGTDSSASATKEVTATLTQLLTSNMVQNRVRSYSDALSDFNGSISASQVGQTNMIVVKCTDDSPEAAFLAVCAIEELFPTVVSYVSHNCAVQVIRNPAVSGTPINMVNSGRLILTASLLGAAAMAALLCWISITRGTIQTRSGARHLLDAPIIATIGRVRKKRTLKEHLRPGSTPLQVFSPTTNFA